MSEQSEAARRFLELLRSMGDSERTVVTMYSREDLGQIKSIRAQLADGSAVILKNSRHYYHEQVRRQQPPQY